MAIGGSMPAKSPASKKKKATAKKKAASKKIKVKKTPLYKGKRKQ